MMSSCFIKKFFFSEPGWKLLVLRSKSNKSYSTMTIFHHFKSNQNSFFSESRQFLARFEKRVVFWKPKTKPSLPKILNEIVESGMRNCVTWHVITKVTSHASELQQRFFEEFCKSACKEYIIEGDNSVKDL